MLWLGSSPRCGDMQTVILCGGTGVRAMPSTLEVPKPLLLVGDRPVLAHVMEIYADQGFIDFVLAAGYKAELVWKFAQSLPASWQVEVVDTGEET
jgi:glucose-1-phosphate cytidylyltransferase